MTTLDRVIQLQQEGYADAEIVDTLREEGISPKEIEESLSQSKIKEAVSQQPDEEVQNPEEYSSEDQYSEEYPPQEENYTEQTPTYNEEGYYPESAQQNTAWNYNASSGTISEIAEQIVNEKLDKYKKITGDLVKYKSEADDKLRDLDERLKIIENSIEQLQRDIIKKVGEFGESNALVHQDLENLHGTMSKMMNPLMDNYKELKKLNEKSNTVITTKKVVKKE